MGRRDGTVQSETQKPTCQTCRTRKVKCDGNVPACNRCVQGRRQCSYVRSKRLLFRHSKLTAALPPLHRARLPTTGSERDFDGAVADCPDTPGAAISQEPGVSDRLQRQPGPEAEPGGLLHRTPDADYPGTIAPTANHGHYHYPVEPAELQGPARCQLDSSTPRAAQLTPQSSASKPTSRGLTPIEGELLHFYVCNIGPWLDVTSPERHYTYTVPRLSMRHPLLSFAIMACSAHILRLLSHNQRHDLADHEERYQHKCVSLLIPMLDDNLAGAVQDEVVLATIVILRMSEQYNEYHVDQQFHLVPQAFSHFVTTGPSSTAPGGLREATFYNYVRSDVRMAILGRRPTRMRLDSWPLDTSCPTNDADWANRITWLVVQVINLCYGADEPGVLPHDEIIRLVDDWWAQLPDGFEPYYYEENPERPFPVIRLLCPWHIIGLQYYHTCKILLAAQRLQDGVFRDILHINRHIAAEILPHARRLCAISFSNEHWGCRMNGSHQIALGAQFFNGKHEQKRVLEYFQSLQEHHAWPSRACCEMLAVAYGEMPE